MVKSENCIEKTGESKSYRSTIKEVHKRPIFIGISRHRKTSEAPVYHVISLKQVESLRPIRMSEKLIASLFGLRTDFDHLIDLYQHHSVKFKFLHVEMNPKNAKDGRHVSESLNLPGQRMFSKNCKEIRVGVCKKNQTYWIPSSMFVSKQIFCRKNPDTCRYSDHRETIVRKHEESCLSEPIIKTKRKVYGLSRTMLDNLVDERILPENFRDFSHNYLATFDIETLQQSVNKKRTDFLTTEAHHNIVSIGVSTNIPGYGDRWFCRRSSDEVDGTKCVALFLKYLQRLQTALEELIPQEIIAAIEQLEIKSKECSFHEKSKTAKQLNFLKQMKQLQVYGFNSGELYFFESLIIM